MLVRLFTVPAGDAAFRVHVEAALAALDAAGTTSRTQAELEAVVHLAYPRAQILAHDRVEGSDPTVITWHVYRDGRTATGGFDLGSDWLPDDALPHFWFDETGTYTGANEAAAELVGLPISEIVGSRVGRFTQHEPDPAPGLRALDVLARDGMLASTAEVLGPDATIPVDYRITRQADGYEMVMRRRG